MSGKPRRCANRAAQAQRLAATALRLSQSTLGAYYRRMCARMDLALMPSPPLPQVGPTHLRHAHQGQEYTDWGQDYFEERYRQRVLHNLAQKANAMGMQLVPCDSPA